MFSQLFLLFQAPKSANFYVIFHLSLSNQDAESFLQQFHLFCSSLALTKIILYFQQRWQVIRPPQQLIVSPL